MCIDMGMTTFFGTGIWTVAISEVAFLMRDAGALGRAFQEFQHESCFPHFLNICRILSRPPRGGKTRYIIVIVDEPPF